MRHVGELFKIVMGRDGGDCRGFGGNIKELWSRVVVDGSGEP
jgi:hypothetical protein